AGTSYVDVDRADPLGLLIRAEENGRDLLFDVTVFGVLHETHDFDIELSVSLCHALANRVATQVELLRERLVDDGDLRCVLRVCSREFTPSDQWHTKRSKIARIDLVVARPGIRVGSALEALDRYVVAPIVAAEQWNAGHGDAGGAWNGSQLFLQPLEERLRTR